MTRINARKRLFNKIMLSRGLIWSFRKVGVLYFGVLITRILLFRVLY